MANQFEFIGDDSLFSNDQSDGDDTDNKKANKNEVSCLGKSFPDDEARRAYFTEELRIEAQRSENFARSKAFR